jgi:hypothetical protein
MLSLWRILLLSAAAFAAPPAGHNFPSCSARSEQPTSFTIAQLEYASSNAAGSGVAARRGGDGGGGGALGWLRRRATTAVPRLQFALTNNANNYTKHCDIASDKLATADSTVGGADGARGRFDPDAWLPCAGDDVDKPVDGVYKVLTHVQFHRDTQYLVVNQTWYCDDVSPQSP